MARLPRYIIPGQPQHIIQRGNNRQPIFAAAADYAFFRDVLVEAASKKKIGDRPRFSPVSSLQTPLLTRRRGFFLFRIQTKADKRTPTLFNVTPVMSYTSFIASRQSCGDRHANHQHVLRHHH